MTLPALTPFMRIIIEPVLMAVDSSTGPGFPVVDHQSTWPDKEESLF
jgi:hypothetical protein